MQFTPIRTSALIFGSISAAVLMVIVTKGFDLVSISSIIPSEVITHGLFLTAGVVLGGMIAALVKLCEDSPPPAVPASTMEKYMELVERQLVCEGCPNAVK